MYTRANHFTKIHTIHREQALLLFESTVSFSFSCEHSCQAWLFLSQLSRWWVSLVHDLLALYVQREHIICCSVLPWPVPRGWPAESWAAKSPEKSCNTCHSFLCVWCKFSHHGCMLLNDFTLCADVGEWEERLSQGQAANHLPTSRLLLEAGIRIVYLLWYSFICFVLLLLFVQTQVR